MSNNGLVLDLPMTGNNLVDRVARREFSSSGVSFSTHSRAGALAGTGYLCMASLAELPTMPVTFPYTVCFDMKVTVAGSGYMWVKVGQSNGWGIWTVGGVLAVEYYGVASRSLGVTPVVNEWTNVCVIGASASSTRGYINGRLVYTTSCAMNTGTGGLVVGNRYGGSGAPVTGAMRNIRVYNREIAETERMWIYNDIARDKSNV